jgi:hypothetical protein
MKFRPRFRTIVILAFTVAFGVVGSARTFNHTRASGTTPTIAELAWMSGDWQTVAGGRAQVEEHWTLPSGGTMIGMGRTVVNNKTAEFEFLRIEQRGDDIFYVAHPNAQCPQTDFKLTRLTKQEVVFENPEHDFPKRVIYRKNSDGSLVAKVDAGEGTKSQTFSYLPVRR